jgi:hypothetical protein
MQRSIEETKNNLESIIAETNKALKKFMGSVGSEWGALVESLTKPSCLAQLQAAGVEVTRFFHETKVETSDGGQEWDAILVDGDVLVAVEAKSRFRERDLDRMIEKLKRFREFFPHFSACRIHGAAAAIKFDSGVERLASKRGLFVFEPSGEIMSLANPPGFKPKAF